MAFDLTLLTRDPDITAPELLAYDAADRLLLDEAHDALTASGPGEVVVIGDRHGALTLGAVHEHGLTGVRVHQDPLLSERALGRNAARLGGSDAFTHHALGEQLLHQAEVVLMRLPKSLAELAEISDAIARFASPRVRVFAGGRVKHMTLRQNEVLGASFGQVRAGLGRMKSRVLSASDPNPAPATPPFPVWGNDPGIDVALAAYGATFGGATLDHGTRLMLQAAEREIARAQRIVDLGCGNGVVSAVAAQHNQHATIIATDQSHAAVQAAELTVRAAGVNDRVTVLRGDAAEHIADASADLILLNPPFHSGTIVSDTVGTRIITDAARALAPGGTLIVVHNSHLRYRAHLEATVGPVKQLARNRQFTVVAAVRPRASGQEGAP